MSSQTKLIKDIFSLYNTILENKEMVEDLSNYILDNREVKITETIRRKQHKNKND